MTPPPIEALTTEPAADASASGAVTGLPLARGRQLARTLAVTALVGTAVLEVVSTYVEPSMPEDKTALLAGLGAHLGRAVLSLVCFVGAQAAGVGAALGVAHLLRHRSPRLGVVGVLLTVLGSTGHAVYGGINLVVMAMAADPANRATYAALLPRVDAQPVVGVFALLGLSGVVAGTLLLSIGLFRGRVGPRWVGPALWAFLLVEFVGSSIVDWLSYVSVLMAAAAYLALARQARRSW